MRIISFSTASAEHSAFHGHGLSLLVERTPLRGLQARAVPVGQERLRQQHIASRKCYSIFKESSRSAYAKIRKPELGKPLLTDLQDSSGFLVLRELLSHSLFIYISNYLFIKMSQIFFLFRISYTFLANSSNI